MHMALHAATGLCLWTVLAVLVLGVTVAVLAIHFQNQKARKARLERQSARTASAKATKG